MSYYDAKESPPPMPTPGNFGAASSSTPEFGKIGFTDDERVRIRALLTRNLAREETSTRSGPGGSSLTYLQAHKAIQLANYIFHFDGWSSTVVEHKVDYMDRSKKKNGSWDIGAHAILRVTLRNGCFKEDIGYGSAQNMQKQAGLEKALKEAVTDGLKRCLRQFGEGLGNCLYDKTFLRKNKSGRNKSKPLALHEGVIVENPASNTSSNIGRVQSAPAISHPVLNMNPVMPKLEPQDQSPPQALGHSSAAHAKSSNPRHLHSAKQMTTNSPPNNQCNSSPNSISDAQARRAEANRKLALKKKIERARATATASKTKSPGNCKNSDSTTREVGHKRKSMSPNGTIQEPTPNAKRRTKTSGESRNENKAPIVSGKKNVHAPAHKPSAEGANTKFEKVYPNRTSTRMKGGQAVCLPAEPSDRGMVLSQGLPDELLESCVQQFDFAS